MVMWSFQVMNYLITLGLWQDHNNLAQLH